MQETPQNNNLQKSELWSLSLRDLFYKYVRFLPWFVLSVALALLGAYAYLRYATPIYSTFGTLVIKTEQQGGKGSDKYDDIFSGGKIQNIQSEIEVLKSKGLMTRVVQKKSLQYGYYVKGKIKTANIYGVCPFYIEAVNMKDSAYGFSLKLKFGAGDKFQVEEDKTLYTFGQTF
ncbi:MAG: Wzz/FepE/Etk N-terminal domain-containing protein, partial [Chitinophagaceae bacterium]